MASNTGQTLFALLTGAAIGAGLGILYAPDKGSKTREKLSKDAKNAQRNLSKQIQETTSSLSEKAQQARFSFEQKLNETLSSASYKADDILLAMEDKLEALRKQNAKLQIDNALDKTNATVENAKTTVAKKVTS
ncbi:YtxH domain-containing protein [Aequorivita sp. SDUM287046]|uniref:YtxH domain-containing protein n=1 Tax=Aequorivita aurantiaca TaxID=3053356 RepID=A0ABT8DD23_9FLAO|nr:YtxH domain-containing protein [Aequorivita aurantiaca]MDN3723075.1 YtxH domain-containing protein [Aequorivita aurantiaca]